MSVAEATTPLKSDQSGSASAEDPALARRFLHFMSMMREVEDRIERKLYRQGKILGGVYVGRGQEAIPGRIGAAGRAGRRAVSLAPRHGRVPDSRHASAPHLRAVHGAHRRAHARPRRQHAHGRHAAEHRRRSSAPWRPRCRWRRGAALAFKYKGTRNVAFCFFGDGATSRGDWHEGVNFAAVQKLPVVYICNNNQYAYSTPLAKQMACANVADRGAGLRHSGRNRRRQRRVRRARRRAPRRRARARRTGPVPDRVQDVPHDRPLRARCRPTTSPSIFGRNGRRRIRSRGWRSSCSSKRWADAGGPRPNATPRSAQEIDEAIEWAENSPYPDPSELLDDVYDRS